MLTQWGSRTVVAGTLAVVLLSGCTGKRHQTTNSFSPEANHIKAAAKLCREYAQDPKNTGKEIDNFSVVRKWAKRTKKRGVTQETFESTRDHQEYMIEPGPMGPMLHEQSGQNGKVYITTPDGNALERTPSEVKAMTQSMKQSMEHYKP